MAVHLTWGSGWEGLGGILSGKPLLEYHEHPMGQLNHERKNGDSHSGGVEVLW